MIAPPLRILVTGAGRGIGRSISLDLLDKGHSLALCSRTTADLESLIVGRKNRTLVIPADVTDPTSADSVIQEIVSAWGGIDVLILNAGDGQASPLEMTTDEIGRAHV